MDRVTMFRALAYLGLGWLLIALVGGLADVLDLTVMLPATSAIVITHAAFSRNPSTTVGLALAVSLGYLEDLYQGAPVGTLSLAYALGFLALRWTAARVALTGWLLRTVACVVTVALLDLLTWGILMALADLIGARRAALNLSLWEIRWHALATALAAVPVWGLVDRLFTALRLVDRPPQHTYWSGK